MARVYAAKTVVVTEGDLAGALLVILEGRCKAYVSDPVGVHAMVAIREAGT
jgi:hypothetical protein